MFRVGVIGKEMDEQVLSNFKCLEDWCESNFFLSKID